MIKFKLFFTVLLIQFMIVSPSFAQNGDSVLGFWQSEHGNARIHIYKNGETYDGKLIWLKEETNSSGKPKVDINNPSEMLRSQPVKGLEVLKNFKYSNDRTWEDGTVYDPRSGKTYDCKLSMRSSDKLEVRAFYGISLIGKTQNWSRVR